MDDVCTALPTAAGAFSDETISTGTISATTETIRFEVKVAICTSPPAVATLTK